MPLTFSRESVSMLSPTTIVLGGIASSDSPCCATPSVDSPSSLRCDPPGSVASWVDSLSLDPFCSDPVSAGWLTSLFCDPVGCEPFSPEHPTTTRKTHPIRKTPTTVMSHAWRTTAHPASFCMCPLILAIGSMPHYEAQRISGEGEEG